MATAVIVFDVFSVSFWRYIHLTIDAHCGEAVEVMLAKAWHNGCLQITIAVIMEHILLATGKDHIAWLSKYQSFPY